VRHSQRISSLRNITWADEDKRSKVLGIHDEYIRLKEKDMPQLRGRSEWEQSKELLTDAELLRLYTGLFVALPTPVR